MARIRAVPFIVSAFVLGFAVPGSAGVHQVWDEAHFVKKQTIEQVDLTLQETRDKYGKDLMIETFASIPDDLKPNLEKDGKDKFYTTWARSEAFQLGVNGVIILITGDPPHLQIEVGKDTQQKAFTIADRDELVTKLAESFKAKDFDGGLVMAAQFVHDRMARNMSEAGAPAATQPSTVPQPSGPGATAPASVTHAADAAVPPKS